jgi:acetyl/propionyl-CoA carboxylase alpha subunit
MRMVRTARELQAAIQVCRSEARAAFGDDSLYLEKWLEDNRHVEVQVVVDRYGHGVHLGERDCSVQRRHQKLIEEAPTPALSEAAREELAERAIRAVVAAGYENLGTLEFLVDRDANFYFIEINCRIQVEHPVTEMRTGIDLVATQLRIAAGEPIGFSQADVSFAGHAIEFRINAEDAAHDFGPTPGRWSGSSARRARRRMDCISTPATTSALLRLPARQADRLGPDRLRRGARDDEPRRPGRRGRLPHAPELRRPVHDCIDPPARRASAARH